MSDIFNKIVNSPTPIIMGIVNITPDSFSDGGKFYSKEKALDHSFQLIEEGAEIIDIGGESTRPGSKSINVVEELNRVIPVITKIRENDNQIIISIDTTKSTVAEEAIKAGANIVNDISGGTFDPEIINVSSKWNSPFVIMHIKGRPENMQESPTYSDVIKEIYDYFIKQINIAKENNISEIILDPGIGFGKTVEDNYTILNSLDTFNELGYPILVGVSKKSFLGKSLNLEVDQRENPTIIAETISAVNGAKIIRTHNVKNCIELKKIISFINKSNQIKNV